MILTSTWMPIWTNEDDGNNTIVLRDDVDEEDAEIIREILGVSQSVNSSNLKLKTKKYEFKLKLDKV